MAFGIAAVGSVLVAVLVLAFVRDAPRADRHPQPQCRSGRSAVRSGRSGPGLVPDSDFRPHGHAVSMMVSPCCGACRPGIPRNACRRRPRHDDHAVRAVLVCFGPVVGLLATRHVLRRSWMLSGVIAADALIWTAVLAFPGPRRTGCWCCSSSCCPRAVPARWSGSTSGGPPSRRDLGVARAWSTSAAPGDLARARRDGGIMTALGGFTPEAFRVPWLIQYRSGYGGDRHARDVGAGPMARTLPWRDCSLRTTLARSSASTVTDRAAAVTSQTREPEQNGQNVPRHGFDRLSRLPDEVLNRNL